MLRPRLLLVFIAIDSERDSTMKTFIIPQHVVTVRIETAGDVPRGGGVKEWAATVTREPWRAEGCRKIQTATGSVVVKGRAAFSGDTRRL